MGIFSDVLLTVDYDRTLTAPDSTIPQRNIDAIHYFMDNGGTFTVNTGRSIPMASEMLIPNVPVNAPLLLYNGSAAYDKTTGKFTRYTPIEVDPTVILPELMEKFPQLNLEVQAVDAHYMLKENAVWEAYNNHNHCPWGYISPNAVPEPFLKFSFYGEFRSNAIADMYNAYPWELELFRNLISYVEQRYGDKLDIFLACPRIADFHAKGVSKLRSARLLQAELGKKILVCVGDAENDVNMLDGADYAFCPSDGIVADRYENVCCCADGAVADVIYKKIPEILQIKP